MTDIKIKRGISQNKNGNYCDNGINKMIVYLQCCQKCFMHKQYNHNQWVFHQNYCKLGQVIQKTCKLKLLKNTRLSENPARNGFIDMEILQNIINEHKQKIKPEIQAFQIIYRDMKVFSLYQSKQFPNYNLVGKIVMVVKGIQNLTSLNYELKNSQFQTIYEYVKQKINCVNQKTIKLKSVEQILTEHQEKRFKLLASKSKKKLLQRSASQKQSMKYNIKKQQFGSNFNDHKISQIIKLNILSEKQNLIEVQTNQSIKDSFKSIESKSFNRNDSMQKRSRKSEINRKRDSNQSKSRNSKQEDRLTKRRRRYKNFSTRYSNMNKKSQMLNKLVKNEYEKIKEQNYEYLTKQSDIKIDYDQYLFGCSDFRLQDLSDSSMQENEQSFRNKYEEQIKKYKKSSFRLEYERQSVKNSQSKLNQVNENNMNVITEQRQSFMTQEQGRTSNRFISNNKILRANNRKLNQVHNKDKKDSLFKIKNRFVIQNFKQDKDEKILQKQQKQNLNKLEKQENNNKNSLGEKNQNGFKQFEQRKSNLEQKRQEQKVGNVNKSSERQSHNQQDGIKQEQEIIIQHTNLESNNPDIIQFQKTLKKITNPIETIFKEDGQKLKPQIQQIKELKTQPKLNKLPQQTAQTQREQQKGFQMIKQQIKARNNEEIQSVQQRNDTQRLQQSKQDEPTLLFSNKKLLQIDPMTESKITQQLKPMYLSRIEEQNQSQMNCSVYNSKSRVNINNKQAQKQGVLTVNMNVTQTKQEKQENKQKELHIEQKQQWRKDEQMLNNKSQVIKEQKSKQNSEKQEQFKLQSKIEQDQSNELKNDTIAQQKQSNQVQKQENKDQKKSLQPQKQQINLTKWMKIYKKLQQQLQGFQQKIKKQTFLSIQEQKNKVTCQNKIDMKLIDNEQKFRNIQQFLNYVYACPKILLNTKNKKKISKILLSLHQEEQQTQLQNNKVTNQAPNNRQNSQSQQPKLETKHITIKFTQQICKLFLINNLNTQLTPINHCIINLDNIMKTKLFVSSPNDDLQSFIELGEVNKEYEEILFMFYDKKFDLYKRMIEFKDKKGEGNGQGNVGISPLVKAIEVVVNVGGIGSGQNSNNQSEENNANHLFILFEKHLKSPNPSSTDRNKLTSKSNRPNSKCIQSTNCLQEQPLHQITIQVYEYDTSSGSSNKNLNLVGSIQKKGNFFFQLNLEQGKYLFNIINSSNYFKKQKDTIDLIFYSEREVKVERERQKKRPEEVKQYYHQNQQFFHLL